TVGTKWIKWLESEFTDWKVRGLSPTFASRLALSRLGQPGSIPALILPLGGVAARHRKSFTAEQFFLVFSNLECSRAVRAEEVGRSLEANQRALSGHYPRLSPHQRGKAADSSFSLIRVHKQRPSNCHAGLAKLAVKRNGSSCHSFFRSVTLLALLRH
ncbi:hypothetical protein CSKR_109577, partial [Clonorchis sinensis]